MKVISKGKVMKHSVVSYQMGKVGSSSITASIDDCIQMHSWSADNPYTYFSATYNGSLKGRLLEDLRWKYLFYRLQKKVSQAKRHDLPVKLIVGVRDPVARNVSGYFQSLTSSRRRKISILESLKDYYVNCPHFLPVTWFDIEMKRKLGVDVYSYSFDQDVGCSVFCDSGFEIFVYQQEKMKSLETQLGKFLDIDGFQLVNKNDSGDKWYGDLYKEFRDEFRPSEHYLKLLYESGYFEHFYSDRDKEVFMERWLG